MPIITNCEEVRAVYKNASQRKWVIPCLCSENLTTTEAILTATQDFAIENNLSKVPISLAITVRYDHRAQSENYTHTRDWSTGLKLFKADAKILANSGLFPNVDILLHLDHVQHDKDKELLSWDLSDFSSIMFDASTLPFDENILATAEFVKKMKSSIVIEGACDEIFDASGNEHNALSTPENAERFYHETGADMIVANLGTEHRASGQVLHYYGDVAEQIRDKIGQNIVLHGLSSVPLSQVKNLYHDGVCKANIWTILERDASVILLDEMLKNSDKIAGSNAKISHFTTMYRQDIVFNEMKKIIRSYLDMWYTTP